jgi:glycosyltransferase involved in cell wall biosynthesis
MYSDIAAKIEVTSDATPMGTSPAPSDQPFLSIVIPVRNAAGSLPEALLGVSGWVAAATMSAEVIIVDDASADGTRAAASAFYRRLPNLQVLRHVDARGPLESIRTGERAASGTLIVFGRVNELAASLEAGPDLVESIVQGADVAALPRAPERIVTPIPPTASRRISDQCREWLRRAVTQKRRDPVLYLCRANALRKMTASAMPADLAGEPDWLALARRTFCTISVVRRGSSTKLERPRPARSA